MVLDVSIGRYLAEKDVLKKAEVFCREFPSSSKASNFFAEYPELLVPALIEIAKDEKSPQKRNALFFLATMKEPRASDIFIKYLRSNDSKERVFAAQGIGNIGYKKASKDLANAWFSETIGNKYNDKNGTYNVQREIAMALAKLGDEQTIPYLVQTYNTNNDNEKVKLLSVVALYEISKDEKYLNIIKETLSTKNYAMQHELIFLLSDICGKNNKNTIIPLLEKRIEDNDPKIRRAARDALISIKLNADAGR